MTAALEQVKKPHTQLRAVLGSSSCLYKWSDKYEIVMSSNS